MKSGGLGRSSLQQESALHDLKVPTLLSCGIGDVWVLSITELQVSLRIGAIGHVLAVVMMFLTISLMVRYNLLHQTGPLPYFVALTGRKYLQFPERLFKKRLAMSEGRYLNPARCLPWDVKQPQLRYLQ